MESIIFEAIKNSDKGKLLLLKKKLLKNKSLSNKDLIAICNMIEKLIDETEEIKQEIATVRGLAKYANSRIID